MSHTAALAAYLGLPPRRPWNQPVVAVALGSSDVVPADHSSFDAVDSDVTAVDGAGRQWLCPGHPPIGRPAWTPSWTSSRVWPRDTGVPKATGHIARGRMYRRTPPAGPRGRHTPSNLLAPWGWNPDSDVCTAVCRVLPAPTVSIAEYLSRLVSAEP